ncbi:MAG: T9SS type A sorting domain-containing protein [Saprospiraceae bacterium]|nr:T9SS type A sorting domain-containing protein [Saprospiraceae bacterium]
MTNFQTYTKPLAVLIILMTYATVSAQGWEKVYGGVASDVANDLAPTADGGWFMAGSSSNNGGTDLDVYLLKTDVDGSEQWHRYLGIAGTQEIGNSLATLPGGGYAIAGTASNGNSFVGKAWGVDALGNPIWEYTTSLDTVQFEAVSVDANGNVYLTGSKHEGIYVVKLDANGNEVWTKTIDGNDIESSFDLVVLSNQNILIAGYTHSNLPSVDAYLAEIDADGTIVWEETYGSNDAEEQARAIAVTPGGQIYLAGFIDDGTANGDNVWLAKIESDGTLIYEKTIPQSGFQMASGMSVLSNGNLIISGETRIDAGATKDAFLLQTDADGNQVWERKYGGQATDIAAAVQVLANGFAFCGATESFGAGSTDAWLVQTDANGLSLSSILTGNVFQDLNLDGLLTPGEPGIEDWIISVEGNKTYYTSSDETGFFAIAVDTGDYTVRLNVPNPYWLKGLNDPMVSITQQYDTTEIFFPVEKASDCSFLTIDVGTPFLRRCFSNVYRVEYCNEGTQTATGAFANLQLDPYLVLDSASVNFSDLGNNLYQFNLGDLAPFDCGNFKLFTTVACDSTLLGQTHCIEARIFPDTFCLTPDPNWDGASLDLEAVCVNDTIQIIVKNTGDSDMTGRSGFIIIEDDVLTKSGTVQVGSGMDTLIKIPVAGQTVRFEVQQSPGHPGNSFPSIAIEGCGDFPFSTGYVNQFPQDDGDNFVEIDCRENIGAYDPNDKMGFPKGYSFLHYILPNGELEYLIRFQNTGTDTAFTVVIRDTLQQDLDVNSIQPGAASHDYDFEVYGNGILKFTFDNILLVDSFTNEPASHGFVKFRVAQTPDLASGTVINNNADIYFDYNAPVITPETDHTIATNFIKIDTTTSVGNLPGGNAQINAIIAPNPFHHRTHISLEGLNSTDCSFVLYNLQGQMILKEAMNASGLDFERRQLPAGTYIFQIRNTTGMLVAGKIVLR